MFSEFEVCAVAQVALWGVWKPLSCCLVASYDGVKAHRAQQEIEIEREMKRAREGEIKRGREGEDYFGTGTLQGFFLSVAARLRGAGIAGADETVYLRGWSTTNTSLLVYQPVLSRRHFFCVLFGRERACFPRRRKLLRYASVCLFIKSPPRLSRCKNSSVWKRTLWPAIKCDMLWLHICNLWRRRTCWCIQAPPSSCHLSCLAGIKVLPGKAHVDKISDSSISGLFISPRGTSRKKMCLHITCDLPQLLDH